MDPNSAAANISPDGRCVVFQSTSTDVVPDDTNDLQDVFAYDRLPALVSSEPAIDRTLPKTQYKMILCAFDQAIVLPVDRAALTVTSFADPNHDLSALFACDVDPGDPTGCTLRATKIGARLVDQTWYHVSVAPEFHVAAFSFELCKLEGDANSSGRVTAADCSTVKMGLGNRIPPKP